VLRVEDLDLPRRVPAAVTGNLDELRWLGLDWDEGPDVGGGSAPYLQSERSERYEEALAALAERGLLGECFLSRKDLQEAASAPHGPAGPV
jgi:glutamyl-tRNA synthetase